MGIGMCTCKYECVCVYTCRSVHMGKCSKALSPPPPTATLSSSTADETGQGLAQSSKSFCSPSWTLEKSRPCPRLGPSASMSWDPRGALGIEWEGQVWAGHTQSPFALKFAQ